MRFLIVAALLTASCGRGGETVETTSRDLTVADVREESAGGSAVVSAPQIAYGYRHGYRLDPGDIPAAQRRHTAMCDALGPARCRISSLTRDAGDGRFVTAGLSLLVDARIARPFGDRLDAAVTGAGGDVASRGIEAEDLSKQIVDVGARVRGKQALSDRLLLLLQNRTGKVGELVEAERAYASAQEELDAARSMLAEMRGRVAMSKVDIQYASTAPVGGGAWPAVRDSLAESGQMLGWSVAALIRFALILLPWALLAAVLVAVGRRRGWRPNWRWPRRPATVPRPD